MNSHCEFTGGECDKGRIYDDGSVGCGYFDADRNQCVWYDDLPQGMRPRDFYNTMRIKAVGVCEST